MAAAPPAAAPTEPVASFPEYVQEARALTLLNKLVDFNHPDKFVAQPLDAMSTAMENKLRTEITEVSGRYLYGPTGERVLAVSISADNYQATATSAWIGGIEIPVPAEESTDASKEKEKDSAIGVGASAPAEEEESPNHDDPVEYVNSAVATALLYKDCRNQAGIDRLLEEIDPAPVPEIAMLVSSAVSKVAAKVAKTAVYESIGEARQKFAKTEVAPAPVHLRAPVLPMPWFASQPDMKLFVVPSVQPMGVSLHGLFSQWRTVDGAFRKEAGVAGLCDEDVAIFASLNSSETHTTVAACARLLESLSMDPAVGFGAAGVGSRAAAAGKDTSALQFVVDAPRALVEGGSVTPVADGVLYDSPATNGPPRDRLVDVKPGTWVVVRPSRFPSVSALIAFAEKARGKGCPLVVVPDDLGTVAEDETPFPIHVAVGLSAEAVLLPAPHGGHATGMMNEFLRVEETVLKKHRRYFLGSLPPFAASA